MTADNGNGISEEETQETDSFVTNEINVPTAPDTVSVNAEAGPSNYTANKQFKTPTNKQNQKRKAVDVIQGRMDEAYKILKTAVSEKPKTSQTSLYGQLVAQKLETLNELQRVIVMNEIDNVLFRATMRHMGAYSTDNTLQLQHNNTISFQPESATFIQLFAIRTFFITCKFLYFSLSHLQINFHQCTRHQIISIKLNHHLQLWNLLQHIMKTELLSSLLRHLHLLFRYLFHFMFMFALICAVT